MSGGQLPAGFKLDEPQGGGAELPAGFTLDAPSARAETPRSALDFVPAVPLGETALSLATGAAGAVAGGISGLAGAVMPGEPGQGARRAAQVQDALTYQPRTRSGQAMTEAVSLPFEKLAEVGDAGGQVIADASKRATGSTEDAAFLGAAANTVIQAMPALIGKVLPKASPGPAKPWLQKASDAGYRVMPDEGAAGPVTKAAANLAGEPKLAKNISKKNQPIHNEKIVADLGLPEGTALDLDTVRAVRKQAGSVYEEVRGAGRVTPSQAYTADLDALGQKYANVSKDFPDLAQKDVQAVIDAARVPGFDSSAAVDLINQLRASADDAFSQRNSSMGKVYRGVADAVEAELARHLQATGNAPLYQRFTQARERIAKAHLAEKALGGGTDINPQVYGQALAKNRPLTGEAREVAEFSKNFPRSAMKTSGAPSAGGPTFMDAALALFGGDGGAKQGAGILFARPLTRALLASRPYQSAFVSDPGLRRILTSPEAAKAVGIGYPIGMTQQEEHR